MLCSNIPTVFATGYKKKSFIFRLKNHPDTASRIIRATDEYSQRDVFETAEVCCRRLSVRLPAVFSLLRIVAESVRLLSISPELVARTAFPCVTTVFDISLTGCRPEVESVSEVSKRRVNVSVTVSLFSVRSDCPAKIPFRYAFTCSSDSFSEFTTVSASIFVFLFEETDLQLAKQPNRKNARIQYANLMSFSRFSHP